METTEPEPPRIRKISIDFKFDEQYVEKRNPCVATYMTKVFEHLRTESWIDGGGCGGAHCLFAFGTWSCGHEIKIGRYNCAPTMVTIENVWNEENVWEHDRAIRVNKILRECPDTLIQDFVIGTVKIIEEIKNYDRLVDAKFRVSFRIAYTGIQTAQSEAHSIVYDSTTGFIC